ncbi:MAG: hypothetical protein KatS3mg102_1817 [Planctomycetota bacterium]|nr:MAG: hypothetical protein KatS3mg102_1817 [Planctomycetota bacterium]
MQARRLGAPLWGALILAAVTAAGIAACAGAPEQAGAPAAAGGPAVGELAPDFALPDTEGRLVRLSDFRGRPVVVAFVPAAFSPGCTREMEAFRNLDVRFRDLGAQVLGISVDSRWALRAWKEWLKLPFPLLSDFSREAARAWGVLDPRGHARRTTFVIGRDGRVLHVERDQQALEPAGALDACGLAEG